MKINKTSGHLAIILAAGLLTFTSCSKKTKEVVEETSTDTEQSSSTDNALSEGIVNDIESMGSEASENSSITTFKTSGNEGLSAAPCATVTIAGKIITVDFGTNCQGADNKTRSGKLIYNFSASNPASAIFYRNPGFSMNVTSQNYVVDGYSVNINNKTVTNTTPPNAPPGSNLTWSISANISIVKPNNGGTITWLCNRTKDLVLSSAADTTVYKGQGKPINWLKAKIRINGSASGVNASGESYTSVASNLIRKFDCAPDPLHIHRHPFVSGTITFTPANRFARIINYGNENDCDFNATLTINGVTYNIVLP